MNLKCQRLFVAKKWVKKLYSIIILYFDYFFVLHITQSISINTQVILENSISIFIVMTLIIFLKLLS